MEIIHNIKECTLCKHAYTTPCNGEKNDCQNAVWVRSKGTIDIHKISYEQLMVFRKSGKQIPDVPPTDQPKPKRHRVRL